MKKPNLKSVLTLDFARKNTKALAIIVIAVFLIGTIAVASSYDVSVKASAMPSALHTDGKYIVDGQGNIIYLRGLQKVEMADDPDGTWMGSPYWSDANVRTELQAMKAWGANTVRCIQSIDNWKYDLGAGSGYASISNRDAVQRLAKIAGEENMYVIFTAYRVTNYYNGGNQDPLPYPPYQSSAGASAVIGSTQDFVDYWSSVASVMKDYPNVVFEIWNEPTGGDPIQFFNVQQQVINAIRATGAQNIIMAQWDMGSWVNLDSPDSGGSTMDWINTAQLTDSLNNLVYVTHIYREYGQTGIYSNGESIAKWGTNHAYDKAELERAFTAEKLYWVLNTLNKPVFVTECGANMDHGGAEATREVEALNNSLAIFNEWGINYIVHWWREIGIFRLHTGAPNFTPTAGGEVVKYQLQHQPAVPHSGILSNSGSNSNSYPQFAPITLEQLSNLMTQVQSFIQWRLWSVWWPTFDLWSIFIS